jgi:hypothetical protein
MGYGKSTLKKQLINDGLGLVGPKKSDGAGYFETLQLRVGEKGT